MGKDQVLHLNPSDSLKFKGPFNDVVISELHLTNPSAERVAFKVKTTAPKRYCVRPNSGILDPAGKITVQVMLQPLDFDPANEKNRHKFMVQTAFVPEGTTDQETLWKTVSPDALMDTKLKCIFDLPEETEVPSVAKELNVELPAPSQDADPSVPAPTLEPVVLPSKALPSVEINHQKLLDDNDVLRKELNELKKELARGKEENLRLRKVAVSDTVRTTPKQVPASSGSWASGDASHGSKMSEKNEASPLNMLIYLIVLVCGIVAGIVIAKTLYV